ncbi:hypothetical protein CHARACLAT_032749 [Characodon lateralis]|uniref:Uncharacterized protein n=1 Tax=Characodon lateralis TaxID=208331 RepID=A0ABU7F9Y6_9TELE|nr:hypothetical protein [Characodon lateralis]
MRPLNDTSNALQAVCSMTDVSVDYLSTHYLCLWQTYPITIYRHKNLDLSDTSAIPVPSLQEMILSIKLFLLADIWEKGESLLGENRSAKISVGKDHGGHKGPDVKAQTQPA